MTVVAPLKIEGFGPVLDALGEREAVTTETIVWIVVVFALLLILPVVAYRVRRWMRRRDALARGFDQLQRVGDHKGFTPSDQSALERIALAVAGTNPALIVSTVEGFDAAVKARMKEVRRLPWLEMEQEVERIASVREKLGFRYIAEDRHPQNTRHLVIGQRLYILARGSEHFRLLSAPIVELTDLAIYTEPFQEGDQPVRLSGDRRIWAFFWSPAGGECRFSTRMIKSYDRPAPYLMFEHADDLVYNCDRKIFSCDLEATASAERVSGEAYGRSAPSEALFEKHNTDSVPVQLIELSASGFVVGPGDAFKMNDLVRLEVADPELAFLDGWPARVVTDGGPVARCRFLKKSRDRLETILAYVTPRISKDALKGRSRRKAVNKSP